MGSPSDSFKSDVPSGDILGTFTIRDKSLLKRNINKHHNNNFSAGFVPVHEEDLHKTGLRGRQLTVFWTVIAVLCVLVFANVILLLIMVCVLRIGLGMESLEIIPDHSLLKFYGNTDLGQIYKRDGFIQGFRDEPFLITGEEIHVDILTSERDVGVRVMSMDDESIVFEKVKSFEVKNAHTGNEIFSTTKPSFRNVKRLKNFHVDFVETNRVTSPVARDLLLRSDSYIRLKGNEGTTIEGKDILMSADQHLFLKSVNGSIILNGTEGISLEMAQMLQFADEEAAESSDLPCVSQFKVCVCMPSGKLFKVAVHAGQSSHDACSMANIMPHLDPCKLSI